MVEHAAQDQRRDELANRVNVLIRPDGVEPSNGRHLHLVLALIELSDQLARVLGERVGVLVEAVEHRLGDVVDPLHPGAKTGVHHVVRADDVDLAGEAGDGDQLGGPEDAGEVIDFLAALEGADH